MSLLPEDFLPDAEELDNSFLKISTNVLGTLPTIFEEAEGDEEEVNVPFTCMS